MTSTKEDYQSITAELDEIITDLQGGKLDIDEATKAYERGMQLIQKLEKHLKQVENKVTKIKAAFDTNKES